MDESNARQRDLFRGSLEVLVLSLIADGCEHGYAIQKQLRHSTGQSLTYGTLYPLLHRLESSSLIASDATTVRSRQRKTYTLTSLGRRHLRKAAADWQGTIARYQALVLPAVRRVATRDNAST